MQNFSYIYRFQVNFDQNDHKLDFLAGTIYYSLFTNLLVYIKSFYLTITLYIISFITLIFFLFYVIFLSFFDKMIRKSNFAVKIIGFFNLLYTKAIKVYYWFFLLPCIELFNNVLYCEIKGSFFTCEEKESFGLVFMIISLFGILGNILLGLAYLWIHQNYSFLNMREIAFEMTFNNILTFFMKVTLPLLFPMLVNNYQIVYYLIIAGIFTFSIIEYYQKFPVRNPKLNRLYLILLLVFLGLVFLMLLLRFTNILNGESGFIIICFITVFLAKLGENLFSSRYLSLISNNYSSRSFSDYVLEEFILGFERSKISLYNRFFLIGMLKLHAKRCKAPQCKLNKKHMEKFEKLNIEQQERRITLYLLQSLRIELENAKKDNDQKRLERFVFKYITYLLDSGINASKTLYEIQRILQSFSRPSLFSSILLKLLIKKANQRMKEHEFERKLILRKFETDKSLDTACFFALNKQKISLEKHMKALLKMKIAFWERYNEGFNSYEDVIKEIYQFMKQVSNYKKRLDKSILISDNIIILKFQSIFSCIILNHIHDANKFEDELENIKKRYIRISKETLSPLSFLQDNMTTCEASFLNKNGLILEKSKTEKFASFFGYKHLEIKLLNSINQLMPELIAQNHQSFFEWGLSKSRKEKIHEKNEIFSFAINKKNFIFPVKIFLGNSLQYQNDFVVHAALLKMNLNDQKCFIFEITGLIMGTTEQLFEVLLEEYGGNIPLNTLNLMNLYCLIPKIKDIINSNKTLEQGGEVSLRNINALWLFPSNLLEIMEVIKFKKEAYKGNSKYIDSFASSVRTLKSAKSSASKTINKISNSRSNINFASKFNSFFSKFIKTNTSNNLTTKKEFIIKQLELEGDIYNETLINGLIEHKNMKKRRLNFDLSFNYYKYGKTPSESLHVCYMKINSLGSIEIEESESIVIIDKEIELIASERDKLDNSNITSIKGIEMPLENNAKFDFDFQREEIPSMNSDNKGLCEEEGKEIEDIKIKQTKIDLTNNTPNKTYNLKITKSYDINNSKKQSLNSYGSYEDEIKRMHNLNGGTSAKDNMLLNLADTSQKPSSVSTLKKSFTIFNTIGMIKEKFPRSIYLLMVSLLIQIIFIIAYCLIIFFFATDYVSNSYIPLQSASINKCRTNIGLGLATLVLIEYEYSLNGLSIPSDFYNKELNHILNISYYNSKDLFYKDRVIDLTFDYISNIQTLYVSYVDYRNPNITTQILMPDLTDLFFQVINTFLSVDSINQVKDYMKIFSRNFQYYLNGAMTVRALIQDEFSKSIDVVTNNIVLVMSLMIGFVTVIKLLEYFLFYSYQVKITKLVNIFMRISLKDAINEHNLNKEVLAILQDPSHSFLHFYYPDVCLNKKDFTKNNEELLQDLSQRQIKQAAKAKEAYKKEKKKVSLYNLRNLTKTKVYIFLFLTLSMAIGYFFSNYSFWTITASNVANLLEINILFNNLYTYSTTSLTYQSLLIREKIFTDIEYEANSDLMQKHQYRLNLFYNSLTDRIRFLNEITVLLPRYALNAQNFLKDPYFNNILKGDSCITLRKFKIIEKDEQFSFCQMVFNKAFYNGILSIMNEFTNRMTQNPFNNADESESELILLKEYISYNGHIDIIIGDYYLSELLFIFYDYLTDYYSFLLEQQLFSLKTIIWTTCIIFALLLFIIAYFSYRYLISLYLHVSWALALIPYEKLANDEQIIFLIKQFWKDYS